MKIGRNMHFNPFIILIGCVILICHSVVHGRFINPAEGSLMDLTLIDDDGVELRYLEHIAYFREIQNHVDANVKSVCVKSGIFIIFHLEDYTYFEDADEVRILSGTDKCVEPPFALGSLRAVTMNFESFDFMETSFVTLYSEKYYAGYEYTVIGSSGVHLSMVQPAMSLILVGREGKWTFVSATGQTICIIPYQKTKEETGDLQPPLYVCLIPETAEVFDKTMSMADYFFKNITNSCESADAEEMHIDTCYEYSSGELQEPALPPIKSVENQTYTEDEGDENSPFFGLKCDKPMDEIALLIRMRLTNDFVDSYQFILPIDKQHIWRTEMLDSSFEVVTKLVGTVIPPWFVGCVREMFVFFSEKYVWSEGKGWPEEKPNRDVMVTLYQTKKCLDMVGAWESLYNIQMAVEGLVAKGELDNIKPELMMKEMYDQIVEFVWLSINLVAITCHQILEFGTNFWVDYLTIASDMYLKPIVDFWRTEDMEERKYYRILFGGINFKRQYQIEAVFTTAVFDLAKYSEVLPRPEELMTRNLPIPAGNV